MDKGTKKLVFNEYQSQQQGRKLQDQDIKEVRYKNE